jgi:hypothetical protein
MSEQTPKFESERTRLFRTKQLSEREQGTIADIEAFGCSVIELRNAARSAQWGKRLILAQVTPGQIGRTQRTTRQSQS